VNAEITVPALVDSGSRSRPRGLRPKLLNTGWCQIPPRSLDSLFLFWLAVTGEGYQMKIIYGKQTPVETGLYTLSRGRGLYFLCERNDGAAHCQVREGPNKGFPLEEASCLLAMHCMARGRLPKDYVVRVQVAENNLKGLVERTEKLLQAKGSLEHSIELTRREEEVLEGVVRCLPNKEIALSLNVCVRTVKFHVSSLLSKFNVRGRMELVREVARNSLNLIEGPEFLALPEARMDSATIDRFTSTKRKGGSGQNGGMGRLNNAGSRI
jgi:DNA-binding CsgD family transcriptional regulator